MTLLQDLEELKEFAGQMSVRNLTGEQARRALRQIVAWVERRVE